MKRIISIGLSLLAIGVTISLVSMRSPLTSTAITGTVLDEGNRPLVGATVLMEGTASGTFTDTGGFFSLATTTSDPVTLRFSAMGYDTHIEKGVRPGAHLEIRMVPTDEILEEVNIIADDASPYRPRKERAKVKKDRADKAPMPEVPVSVGGEVSEFTSSPTSMDAAGYEWDDAGFGEADREMKDYEEEIERSYLSKDAGVRARQLTAGEINDFQKWNLWEDLTEEAFETHRTAWQIEARQRYTLQLTTPANQPIVDAQADLLDKNGNILWTGHTDNTGKAELWAEVWEAHTGKAHQIRVNYKGTVKTLNAIKPFTKGINYVQIEAPCAPPKAVDIAFVIDATSSMADEIQYIKAELTDVMGRIQDTLPDHTLRLGCVYYRDQGDAYLTRQHNLDANISQSIDFVRTEASGGGGDYPEAVDAALSVAVEQFSWSPTAAARLLFLVLDAPPHQNASVQTRLQSLSALAAQRGIRIIPVTCSGVDKSTEYLMRTLALTTNGTYTFLTDHSGIGNPHLEPSTDTYEVELFNDLLIRVVHDYAMVPDCEANWMQPFLPPSDTATIDIPLAAVDTTVADTPVEVPLAQWHYYPNPTQGPLWVELEGEVEYLYLADISGKLLQRHAINGQRRMRLDLGTLPNGVYFLKCEWKSGAWVSGRIIRQGWGSGIALRREARSKRREAR